MCLLFLSARLWDVRNGGSVDGDAQTDARKMDLKWTTFGRFMNTRVPANERYQPTEYEHAANCATHGFWILPSLLGGSMLYFLSGDQWHRVAAWLYGSGLTGLFVTSTLFHATAWKISHLRKVEQLFHMCDRMAIYFFIAASYSPWLMLRELGPWACHMRWLIWVMACFGSIYVFFFHERCLQYTPSLFGQESLALNNSFHGQVQAGRVAGICSHGSCSCSGYLVYGGPRRCV
ncbi:monocyte to macrophage differentiation factor 2a isoform X3 [Phycodurus eques]|uniref:monocyte to macrophage differentiation factor 2a isoform X3 n=1 Tax=Phycodurus eques TaxID=693459 RepID=UPI002ACE664E|nr:monocyte to macrophage differentiation factor 2a isoform X3 [Phycodurus eques]